MNKGSTKVALVTGASRGIGQAIAERLSQDSITVIINYAHSHVQAQALAETLASRGARAIALKADMGNPDDIRAMFAEVDQRVGRLDLLVNNAAVTQGAPLATISESLIEGIVAVNIKGAIVAAQEAARRLGPGGRIVNISSSTTLFPMTGGSLYTGSKAMLQLLTEVWAKELGPRGITVNSVVPGPTSPGSCDHAPTEMQALAVAASPFGRIGTASEIAAAVAFLCSDDAGWVSGQHLLVNGAASI
jgi:3-oxoacyl-[acyl-carrier protein] reductase